MMGYVIKHIMEENDIEEEEAREMLKDINAEMDEAIAAGHYEEAEDIWESETGLEMDYYI